MSVYYRSLCCKFVTNTILLVTKLAWYKDTPLIIVSLFSFVSVEVEIEASGSGWCLQFFIRMTSAVSRLVVTKLCENGGSLNYQRLHDEIKQHFTVAESVLHGVLRDDDRIAIQEGSKRALRNHVVSPDSLIVAKTPLRLCQRLPRECPGCDKLHLCRYLVCGSCRYG